MKFSIEDFPSKWDQIFKDNYFEEYMKTAILQSGFVFTLSFKINLKLFWSVDRVQRST